MYKNVQVLPRSRILCYKKDFTSRSRSLGPLLLFCRNRFRSSLHTTLQCIKPPVQTPALEDIKSMVFKEMQKFFARDLSTAQSGAPFIGFEMNDWLRKELNQDIAPEGLLDYTEEHIPDIMTCAGVLINLICFNIDVSWHTTST